jgi:hypothetical protein
MALSEDSATQKVMTYIGGLKGTPAQQTEGEAFIKAICKGILDEIKQNGVVNVPDDSNGDTHPPAKMT